MLQKTRSSSKRAADSCYALRAEKSYCSPPTKKEFAPSFKKSLLSLVLVASFFQQSVDPYIHHTPEQNQTTTYSYDPRGLLTSVAQSYNDPATGPESLVTRAYDASGHLTAETTSLNGEVLSSWNQTWNKAGRRTGLHWTADKQGQGAQYTFDQNALGLPTLSQNSTGSYTYYYRDNGLLFLRNTPLTSTTLQRDIRGRITSQTLKRNGATLLSEWMDWKNTATLASYNLLSNTLGLPAESRTYAYDAQGHVIQEPYRLSKTTIPSALADGTQTLHYAFDQEPLQTGNSQASGLGVRTDAYIGGTAINEATMQTSFGQISQVSNLDASGTSKLVNFSYGATGEVYDRYFLDEHYNQALTWDSFQRLVNLTQDGDATSYTWNTSYDGLGRRIQTRYTNNTDTSKSATINYYYDPEVEFMELGHSVNGTRTWNLYGPDRSGTYGGAQGSGGLESAYIENSAFAYQTANNYFGDTVGVITKTYTAPYPGVVGGYGPLPGSDVNHDLEPQWRGHYLDATGFYYMGARYYEPNSGRFLSADPLGHSASLSLYDYCNGDPINGLDPDGRVGKGYDKGYRDGMSADYNNAAQLIGGGIGTLVSHILPVIGTDPGTIAVGGQLNAALGLQFNVSAQLSLSNWADPATRRIGGVFSITPLTGVGTAIGASGGVLMTKSAATSPEQFDGWSGNAGGSISVGSFVGGYDCGNWGKTPTDNFFIGGGMVTSFGLPLEAHTSATWTKSSSWNF